MVWSATSSMKTSGTLVTTMPASVAASTSTVSAPTLPSPMTLQFRRPLMMAAEMRRFRAMSASASRAAAMNSSSVLAGTSTISAPMAIERLPLDASSWDRRGRR